jgi:hypothetical protein
MGEETALFHKQSLTLPSRLLEADIYNHASPVEPSGEPHKRQTRRHGYGDGSALPMFCVRLSRLHD